MTAPVPITRATAVVPSQFILMEELLCSPVHSLGRATLAARIRSALPIVNGRREQPASGDLLDHVAEHRVARFLVHLGLELVLVLQRDRFRGRRSRADLIGEPLEVWELFPALFA